MESTTSQNNSTRWDKLKGDNGEGLLQMDPLNFSPSMRKILFPDYKEEVDVITADITIKEKEKEEEKKEELSQATQRVIKSASMEPNPNQKKTRAKKSGKRREDENQTISSLEDYIGRYGQSSENKIPYAARYSPRIYVDNQLLDKLKLYISSLGLDISVSLYVHNIIKEHLKENEKLLKRRIEHLYKEMFEEEDE